MQIAELRNLGFSAWHTPITALGKRLTPSLKKVVGAARDSVAGIYAFTVPGDRSGAVDVVYAGKAGYGLEARLPQHWRRCEARLRNESEYPSVLHQALAASRNSTVQVWFRPSKDLSVARVLKGIRAAGSVSQYSLDEEAFITLLRERGEPLRNVVSPPRRPAMPTSVESAAVLPRAPRSASPLPVITRIDQQVKTQGAARHKVWFDAFQSWDDSVREQFGEALRLFFNDAESRTFGAKIVLRYSAGPVRDRPVLVLWKSRRGETSRRSAKDVLFDLQGLYFVRNPTDLKTIRFMPLFECLAQ